ncbi:MAG: ABC transporter ATP-binding protein [Desulfuromonadales bacterium]|jgi:ATP-binding cassette, subfamily B, multidrug efflux pump
MNRFHLLRYYISQYKLSYGLGILFIFATNWLAVTIPTYLKLSVDILSQGKNHLRSNVDQLYHYLIWMFVLAILVIVVRTCSRIFFFNPGRAIEYKLKNDLFTHLTKLQRNYYDQNETGSIISRLQNDITGVRLICGFGLMQFFNIIASLSLTPYKMWELSPRLTLYCVVPVFAVFLIVRIGMKVVVGHTKERMSRLQSLSAFIVSSLSGIDVIKNYGLSNWSEKEFARHNEGLLNQSLRISFVRSFLMPILINLENILKVLVLMVGGIYVIDGDFTIGEITAFIAYTGLLTMPLMGLGWLTTLYQQGMVGMTSLETIINADTPNEGLQNLPAETRKALFDKGLSVKNLSFSYGNEPILTDISFSILPGQTVGILGRIGSGKSSLVNCLNRYVEPPPGTVFLGDIDILKLTFEDLRRSIRTVSQDVFLFSESVEQNILFGQSAGEHPGKEKLQQIIHESALREEIERFPEQLDTLVGEKGIMLSGGQKQRISLARSMMEPCDLLILDNVLSAVDYETERFLLGEILKRKHSRALLIVSHRVQALEDADLILVLDEGHLVDQGTHRELIDRPGIYQQTWELQKAQQQ